MGWDMLTSVSKVQSSAISINPIKICNVLVTIDIRNCNVKTNFVTIFSKLSFQVQLSMVQSRFNSNFLSLTDRRKIRNIRTVRYILIQTHIAAEIGCARILCVLPKRWRWILGQQWGKFQSSLVVACIGLEEIGQKTHSNLFEGWDSWVWKKNPVDVTKSRIHSFLSQGKNYKLIKKRAAIVNHQSPGILMMEEPKIAINVYGGLGQTKTPTQAATNPIAIPHAKYNDLTQSKMTSYSEFASWNHLDHECPYWWILLYLFKLLVSLH